MTTPGSRILRTALAALLAAPLLAACSWEPPREPGAIALVVGGRANMPAPQLNNAVWELTEDAFLSRDLLLIVEVSGDPRVRHREALDHHCRDEHTCRGAVNAFHRQLDGLVGRVDAGAAEADPLGAILLAARELADAAISGPRQLVVLDSGLQTTGAMPLQAPGALAADWESVVEPWLADGVLDDLAGVEVLLVGLGATHPPQEELPPAARAELRQLWEGVLTAGGAQVRVIEDGPGGEPPPDGLPEVTPVPVDHGDSVADGSGCFRIRDDQVGFEPNEATFRDPELAREVLTPIAEELTGEGLSVTVVGTTALPEPEPYHLSRDRADAVVQLLIELGVPEATLIPGGVGINFPDYQDPHDAQGRFTETVAVQNRLVFIQPVGRQCD